MKLLLMLIGSLSLAVQSANALDIMHVNDESYERIQTGYDSERQEFTNVCVSKLTFNLLFQELDVPHLILSSSLDQRRVSSEFGFSVGTKFRSGVTKYSIGADFVNNTASSGFSINTTYSSSYEYAPHILELGKVKLNSTGKSKLGNAEAFRTACGDHFVYKQFYGAKLYFNIRIDFDSKKSKQEFQARFSMKGPAVSVNANLKMAKNKFSKRTK